MLVISCIFFTAANIVIEINQNHQFEVYMVVKTGHILKIVLAFYCVPC